MKPASPIKKFGIPILVVSVVGFLIYFGINNLSSNTSNTGQLGGSGLTSTVTDTPVVTTGATSTSTTSGAVGGTIVELLRNIGSITLPDDIFSDASFSMLNDGTVSLPPRNNPGRRNPFSTLSGSGTATSINPTVPDSKVSTDSGAINTAVPTDTTPVVTTPVVKSQPVKNTTNTTTTTSSSSFIPIKSKN